MKYADVLKNFFFSLHSRRFIASLLGSGLAWAGWKYGIPAPVQASIGAPLVAFILGESYADGKERAAAKPDTVNVGNADTVNTQPAQPAQPAQSTSTALPLEVAEIAAPSA